MTEYAELEIGLHRRYADGYDVEFRFSLPRGDADERRQGRVRFDLEKLNRLARESRIDDYRDLLTEDFFRDGDVASAFGEVQSSVHTENVPLRVRLSIGPSAPELHVLYWELLLDPRDKSPLFTREQIVFSRYLSGTDWRRVQPRPRSDLRALVVIANPTDLGEYDLAPVPVADELERAKAGLGEIPVTPLASGGEATLAKVIAQLRDGHDILYLVCHGALIKGDPLLWLENDSGSTDRVPGEKLVRRLRELVQTPTLVVLASCESAGAGVALGPRLAEAGIPAVLAMQGRISIETVGKFMPVFFQELTRDGQIDRAVAVARSEISERPDFWMPVLFMRLKSGSIWYTPGFIGDDKKEVFRKWRLLLSHIQNQKCTPILGPGLTESIVGTHREMALGLAKAHGFPMAPHDRDHLPSVAQYVAIDQDDQFLREEVTAYLRRAILRQFGGELVSDMRNAPLADLIGKVGALRRQDPAEPHRVLAASPFEVFITTNPDTLLEAALEEAGKEPRVGLCPWDPDNDESQRDADQPLVYHQGEMRRETGTDEYLPDPDHPLVYHLFGQIHDPEGMVLTEDDYFRYLIGVTSNKELILPRVRSMLNNTALLFFGFRVEDWNFRMLFHSLMTQPGSRLRRKYTHIAVQVDPEEDSILEPEGARRYLQSYFQGADISIYWGSADVFIKEYAERLAENAQPANGGT